MKRFQKVATGVLYALLTAVLLTGCSNLIEDREFIVVQVERADFKGYKYKYKIKAFPSDQTLYSDEKYFVGDTLKYCR